MNVVMLDDDHNRAMGLRRLCIGHSFTHVTKAKEVITLIEKADIDVLFLDHDLDPSWGSEAMFADAGCGMDVVDWMVANPNHPRLRAIKHIIVHSLAGGKVGEPAWRMMKGIKGLGIPVRPGTWCWLDNMRPLLWAGLIKKEVVE